METETKGQVGGGVGGLKLGESQGGKVGRSAQMKLGLRDWRLRCRPTGVLATDGDAGQLCKAWTGLVWERRWSIDRRGGKREEAHRCKRFI